MPGADSLCSECKMPFRVPGKLFTISESIDECTTCHGEHDHKVPNGLWYCRQCDISGHKPLLTKVGGCYGCLLRPNFEFGWDDCAACEGGKITYTRVAKKECVGSDIRSGFRYHNEPYRPHEQRLLGQERTSRETRDIRHQQECIASENSMASQSVSPQIRRRQARDGYDGESSHLVYSDRTFTQKQRVLDQQRMLNEQQMDPVEDP